MRADDQTRLRHILEASLDAKAFCQAMDQATFANDRRTWRAVVQCIEVIGEAARHVSEAAREDLPDVPWRKIIGM